MEPRDVIDATGINAKTTYRRLASLEKRGFIGRGAGGRPITYRIDENQRFLLMLSGRSDKGSRTDSVLDPSWVVSDGLGILH